MRVGKRKERCHFLPFFGNLRKNYSFFSYFFFFFPPFLFFISPLFRLWPQETKSRRGKGGSFSREGEETRRTLGGEGSVTFEIITPFRATAPEESRFTSDHSARTLGFFSLHSTLWLIHRHHFHSSLRQFAIFFFPLLIPRIMLCHAYSREWKIRTSLSIYINCNFFSRILDTNDWSQHGSCSTDFDSDMKINRRRVLFFNVARDRERRLSRSHVEYRS